MKVLKGIDISRQLKGFFKGSFQINKLLSGYTSIKIGGKAALFLEPENNIDLTQAVKFLNSIEIPFRVIGNGTNLLINDGRLDFAVIKLSRVFFKEISAKPDVLYVRAGVSLPRLLNFSIKNGICGLEFLAGIPGTAGGALVMNAGIRNPFQPAIVVEAPYPACFDKAEDESKSAGFRSETPGFPRGMQSIPGTKSSKFLQNFKGSPGELHLSISDSLIEIEVMDAQGKIFKLNKDDAGFVYRGSKLKDVIVLGAYFKVKNKAAWQVAERIKIFLKKRQISQEMCVRSAGCIFKNPTGENISAGELIERAKLKGRSIGQAQVSDLHANFIVNRGNATFSQVCELMDLVQNKVKQDCGIKLETEVEIWNSRGL
ncbi:MAG: FAD-binding protein [Candidatus Omnitrophica bacterium]|nr:FAD-binding protein [Candidatus Omnitrophota bacterium]